MHLQGIVNILENKGTIIPHHSKVETKNLLGKVPLVFEVIKIQESNNESVQRE